MGSMEFVYHVVVLCRGFNEDCLSHGCFCVVGSMKFVYHMVLLCSGFNDDCLSHGCFV